MISTQNISYGQLIIEEKPAIDTSLDLSLHDQFGNLSEATKTQIMDLHNAYEEEEKLIGIMKTNCFARGDTDYAILCTELSRMNHSCMPNIMTSFTNGRQR